MAFGAHKIIKLFLPVTKSFTYFLRLFQDTKTTVAGKVIEPRDQGNNQSSGSRELSRHRPSGPILMGLMGRGCCN